jgi:hypothetical protein
MIELTLNNHFKFGYDGTLEFQRRLQATERWEVTVGQISSQPNFREAAVQAARAILDSCKLPPAVLLSGGIDSEVCARAFIEAGHPPAVIIGRVGREEGRDFNVAKWVAKHLKLKPIIADIDVISEVGKREVLQAGIFAQTISPQFATHCLLLDWATLHDFTGVLGIGDNELRRSGEDLVVVEREKEAGAYRFAAQRQWQRHVPAFFQYTPELIWSRVAGPGRELWRDLHGDNYFKVKEEFYLHHFPELAPRDKLTGFEHLGWEWDSTLRSTLRRLLPDNSETELEFNLRDFTRYLETGERALPVAVRNGRVKLDQGA